MADGDGLNPKVTTLPAAQTTFKASSNERTVQTASITTVAMLPPVSLLMAAGTSSRPACITASAPYRNAICNLLSVISEMKQVAPAILARFKILNPAGPAPMINTTSSAVNVALEQVCSAMVNGSIITASSHDKCSGMR